MQTIERSGATIARARRETDAMQREILQRGRDIEQAGHDLTEIVLRSMRPSGKAG